MDFSYKSFCWALGTTSFRTNNFSKIIEEQLSLLNDFWELPQNQNILWNGNSVVQTAYYDFMKEHTFLVGNAGNKPKDAREKTSGLVDLGVIDENRRLTSVGQKLLSISSSHNFSSDNFLQIEKDSFIYLKQLLKTSVLVDNELVRPFLVLLYVLDKIKSLPLEGFMYLLPLCTNRKNTDEIINGIKSIKNGVLSVDNIILSRLMEKDNYKKALEYFLSQNVTESLICEIGMNRKSRAYDIPYFQLYKFLYSAFVKHEESAFHKAFRHLKNIKIGGLWKKYLFSKTQENKILNNPYECLNVTLFTDAATEKDFKVAFFEVMHLLKAKATLHDYCDLNLRYIKLSDVIVVEDREIKLDILPKHFFGNAINELYQDAFSSSEALSDDIDISEIHPSLLFNEMAIANLLSSDIGASVSNLAEAKKIIQDSRYKRLHHLIETKFSNDQLIKILDCFEERKESEIQSYVTDNADLPTIFEYILGIIWYKISEYKGFILDYMKLSLDSNLLPKTHASGGEADIVYEYEKTNFYPSHSVLLEATLSEKTNQRRMEMEPVSRHLGMHLLRTGNFNSYCIFVTNYLDINVISDFRSRKTTPFYNPQNYNQSVSGMKIIPISTSDLRQILENKRIYKELYPIFENAFRSEMPPHLWYEQSVKNRM